MSAIPIHGRWLLLPTQANAVAATNAHGGPRRCVQRALKGERQGLQLRRRTGRHAKMQQQKEQREFKWRRRSLVVDGTFLCTAPELKEPQTVAQMALSLRRPRERRGQKAKAGMPRCNHRRRRKRYPKWVPDITFMELEVARGGGGMMWELEAIGMRNPTRAMLLMRPLRVCLASGEEEDEAEEIEEAAKMQKTAMQPWRSASTVGAASRRLCARMPWGERPTSLAPTSLAPEEGRCRWFL